MTNRVVSAFCALVALSTFSPLLLRADSVVYSTFDNPPGTSVPGLNDYYLLNYGESHGSPFVPNGDYSVTKVDLVLRTPTNVKFSVGIYSDDTGTPGSDLGSTPVTISPMAGLETIAISGVSLKAGLTYWLVVVVDQTQNGQILGVVGNGNLYGFPQAVRGNVSPNWVRGNGVKYYFDVLGTASTTATTSPTATPEPGSWWLMSVGLATIIWWRQRATTCAGGHAGRRRPGFPGPGFPPNQPSATLLDGIRSAAACHLCSTSYQQGRRLKYETAHERVIG